MACHWLWHQVFILEFKGHSICLSCFSILCHLALNLIVPLRYQVTWIQPPTSYFWISLCFCSSSFFWNTWFPSFFTLLITFSFWRAHLTFKYILMTCHPKGIKGPFVRFSDSASPSTLPWISWTYWFFYVSSVPRDDDLLEDTNSVLGNSVSPKAHTVKGDWQQSSFLRPATQLWSCLVCVTWFFTYNTF